MNLIWCALVLSLNFEIWLPCNKSQKELFYKKIFLQLKKDSNYCFIMWIIYISLLKQFLLEKLNCNSFLIYFEWKIVELIEWHLCSKIKQIRRRIGLKWEEKIMFEFLINCQFVSFCFCWGMNVNWNLIETSCHGKKSIFVAWSFFIHLNHCSIFFE